MNTSQSLLLIGGTGQLGSRILERIDMIGAARARVLVRPGSLGKLPRCNVGVYLGDLRSRDSLDAALLGVDTVVSTANNVLPGRGDRFGESELDGYRNLVAACVAAGVTRVVLVSAFHHAPAEHIPEFRTKRAIETMFGRSGLNWCALRCSAFMETYFPVVGTRLLLQGSVNPTLGRPHWLHDLNQRVIGWRLDSTGMALIPGHGHASHPYVALDDVARAVLALLSRHDVIGTVNLAGPQALSWMTVAALQATALGAPPPSGFRHVPAWSYAALRRLLAWPSPSASNLMATMHYLARFSMPVPRASIATAIALRQTSAEEVIQTALLRIGRPPAKSAARDATAALQGARA